MVIQPLEALKFDEKMIVDLAKTADIIAVDTESGEEEGMLGISLAFRSQMGDFACYLPWGHADDDNDRELCNLFWDIAKTKTLVFHHAGHDLPVLREAGFPFDGKFYDTMMMQYYINENLPDYSLDKCSKRHGGMPKNRPPIMQFIIDTQGWGAVPLSLMSEYSSHDALITLDLFYKLIDKFIEEGFDGELWDIEQEFILLIAKMIRKGIKINAVFCMKKIIRGEEVMEEIRKKLGINPGSQVGLKHLLLDELGLPILDTTPGGKPSFNAKVMQQYDILLENRKNPIASDILKFRGYQKTVSANYRAYINLCDKDGILHPGYKLHRTVTTRLACDKPALHQIPRESEKEWNGDLKQAFVPRNGFGLWGFDYGQLEFRLAGAYSQEPLLLEVFNTEGRNLFKEMAEELGWDYEPTKRFNYSTIYGGGRVNTSKVFGVSEATAQILINKYYKKYPHLKETQDAIAKLARNRGYVKYWTGRRRHGVEPHKAFNSVVQGGAAELVKRAMIRLENEVCDENCYLLLQIHDEVVPEIRIGMEDEYLPRIKKVMETPPIDFGVQFPVSIKKFGGWDVLPSNNGT